jgi:hypothetical protein
MAARIVFGKPLRDVHECARGRIVELGRERAINPAIGRGLRGFAECIVL